MAIAYDNSAGGSSTLQSPSTTFTVTGTNPILFVTLYDDTGSDFLTSVTYNSVSMTQVAKFQLTTTNYVYVYRLYGPDTGLQTLQMTRSGGGGNNLSWNIASYTGARQSSFPDSSNSSTGTTLTNRHIATIPVQTNCWTFLAYFTANNKEPAAGTGSTKRTSNANGAGGFYDSNGTVSAGASYDMAIADTTGTDRWGLYIASFQATDSATPTTAAASPSPNLLLMGVG